MKTGLLAVAVGLVLIAVAGWQLLTSSSGGPAQLAGGTAPDVPATLVTVRGAVIELPTGRRGAGDGKGADANGATGPLITIRSANETLKVHAGPLRFHSEIGLSLAKNDEIEVTGMRREVPGTPILIAQTVKKGDQVFTIRDTNGEKLWNRDQKTPIPLSSIAGEIVSLAPELTAEVPERGRSGMLIAVQSAEGKLVIQLGPESFRVQQGLTLAEGDHVEIRGWHMAGANVVGTPVMLAESITRGDQTVRVRDAERRALWP